MGAVSLTKRTISETDELLKLWRELTQTEDAKALVARALVDCLLDMRTLASEFDDIDIQTRANV